jgi:hypothetical protein
VNIACAKDLGFENNQYIAIAHRDTNHQHLHIFANRICFDKRTVSDSNNYEKIAKYCRKMELKYELKQLLSPRKYLSKEQRNIPRFDQRKELLKNNIQQALKECYNLQQFEVAMNKRGYQIIKGRGISFTDEKKVTVKGSEVNFSLSTIEKILAQQPWVQAQKQSHLVVGQPIEIDTSSARSISNGDREDIIDDLLKPLADNQEVDKHFLHLTELRELKQQVAKLMTALADKVDDFELKLNKIKVTAPATNIEPITSAIHEGLFRIGGIIEEQPKSITR